MQWPWKREREGERESAMTFAVDWKQKLCPIERRGGRRGSPTRQRRTNVPKAIWEIIGYNSPTIALDKLWKLTEGLRLNYEVWLDQRKKLFFLVD